VRELVARVKALLRRSSCVSAAAPAGLVIDEVSHKVSLDGKDIELTPVEFRLLAALAAAPGRVFSRDGLLEKLLRRPSRGHRPHRRRAREEPAPQAEEIRPGSDLVRSIYGVGYRLEP
jgi:two-component system response regulator BaeR